MPITYQIATGDTIAAIAARFGVTETELLALNPWLQDFRRFDLVTDQAGNRSLVTKEIPIIGAGVQIEKRPERSAAVEALMGGEGGDIQSALSFVLGEGVSLTDAGLIGRLTPDLTRAFEGINTRIAAQFEQTGGNAVLAPTLTPIEFIESLQRTGTLAAMLDNPALTGVAFPKPAITSRKIRV